jgi:hypothetical protein
MVEQRGSVSKRELSWDDVMDGNFSQPQPAAAPAEPLVRRVFREALAEVAARAKAALPTAVNGRIDKAVQIVLAGDVIPCEEDGRFFVGSQSDPGMQHVVAGTCDCPDSDRPELESWCKHKLASALWTRATALSTQRLAAELEPQPLAPATLPEAPASCNVYVEIGGRKVQVTLRDSDEQRMLERLAALLARFPSASGAVETPAAAANSHDNIKVVSAPAAQPACRYHGPAHMRPSKYGEGKFFCSMKLDDGTWCNQGWPTRRK